MNENTSFGRLILKYAVLNVVANAAAVTGLFAGLTAIGVYLEKKKSTK